MKTARQIVLNMLVKMAKSQSYSNILLDEALIKSELSPQDKKFAAALFYGVTERQLTLDRIIDIYSSRPSDKLSEEVRQIIRMGIYQLLYLDSVPESAAVNESVILAKDNKNPAVSGYVNAVLRSFIRDGKKLPKGKDKLDTFSIEYSCPQWLIKKWLNDYGEEKTVTMLRTSLGRAPVTIRVNSIKTNEEKLIEQLAKEGITAEKIQVIDHCLEIFNFSGIEGTECYKNGLFHVQDISSQLCCKALDAKEKQTVLDLCSAPGGKAFTIAQMMNNNGKLFAYDLHEKRAQLIWKGAKRLGLDIIKAGSNNAKLFNDKIPQADRILCDVPCSGLGVIRRKPEIKYKDPAEFDNLPSIQYEILETSFKYLKPGGELVYSTCTLNRQENDEVIDKFINSHSECEPVDFLSELGVPFGNYKATIFPDFCGSDGFFIAKIRKTR